MSLTRITEILDNIRGEIPLGFFGAVMRPLRLRHKMPEDTWRKFSFVKEML